MRLQTNISCIRCGILFKAWKSSSKYCSCACSNKEKGRKIIEKGLRECVTCKVILPKADFNRHHVNRGLYKKSCRSCTAIITKARKKSLPWYHKKITSIICQCRSRANTLGVEFNLTADDIVIPELCPIFGVNFQDESKKKGRFFNSSYAASVDRINNSRGYTKDNIVIVSCRANSIKGDATIDEIEAVAAFYRGLEGNSNA